MILTHVGTATLLLEVPGLRILTDPVFDPPGRRYRIRRGFHTVKLEAPAVALDRLPPIDLVLLSHDHHVDNLDDAGRAFLPRVRTVLTTVPGARRLGGNAVGLEPWTSYDANGVQIVAVPARHGPPGICLVDSVTIGFVLLWPGQRRGALYISGDTVYFAGIAEIARRFSIGTAVLHLGGARFPVTGPLRYTLDPPEAVRTARDFGTGAVVVPVHYEGWSHFRSPREAFARAFEQAGIDAHWLPRGRPVELSD